MSKTSLSSTVASGVELCRLFGKGRQWILDLASKGYVTKAKGGQGYRLADVCQGYEKSLKEAAKGGSRGAEAIAFQKAKTREIEQRMLRDAHKLLPVEEVLSVVEQAMGALRAKLSGTAAAVSRDMAVRAEIERYIDECFNSSATEFRSKAASLRTHGKALVNTAEDDTEEVVEG